MNKKLMAVAVAGAFVTPALVYAQNATVQVYGRANVEYGYVDQGNNRPNTDMFQTPGGSAVGFKGQEQLGGGLAAWFQCESSADVRGLNQDGFCSRNSAIGLRGGWGNLFFGKWDTPMKRAGSIGTVGTGETGVLGASFLTFGNSTGGGASGGQGCEPVISGATCGSGVRLEPDQLREPGLRRLQGARRGLQFGERHFRGRCNHQCQAARGIDRRHLQQRSAQHRPCLRESTGTFGNGANGIVLGAGSGNDDEAWTIGISYNFMGSLLVGAQYIDQKYEAWPRRGREEEELAPGRGLELRRAAPHHGCVYASRRQQG